MGWSGAAAGIKRAFDTGGEARAAARLAGTARPGLAEAAKAVAGVGGASAAIFGTGMAGMIGFAWLKGDLDWQGIKDIVGKGGTAPDAKLAARVQAVHNDVTRLAQQASSSEASAAAGAKLGSPEALAAAQLMMTFEADLLEARAEGPAAEAAYRRKAAEILAKAQRKLSG